MTVTPLQAQTLGKELAVQRGLKGDLWGGYRFWRDS
jgi:hypothetical protein